MKSIILRSCLYFISTYFEHLVKLFFRCQKLWMLFLRWLDRCCLVALWNYRKEIMEPCIKNFVVSFGESGRI